MLESAEVLERAYSAAPPGGKKWHLASDAVAQYENARAPNAATRLQERVSRDYGLDRKLTEIARPDTANPQQVTAVLEEICSDTSLINFGASPCLENIQRVVDVADDSRRADLVDAAAAAMFVAAQSGWRLSRTDPAWRNRFESTLDGFMESGAPSARTYLTYAYITTDRAKRVKAMETAATRFPSDGEIVFALGRAYFDQGRKDDAIRTLSRARDLLPTARQAHVNELLKNAASESPE
jgi:tetratricopeptide (TPR) repeat protein